MYSNLSSMEDIIQGDIRIMNVSKVGKYALSLILTATVALISMYISTFVPMHLISGSVFALLFGMALNPIISKRADIFKVGIGFVSSKVLRLSIILMGATLSFSQVLLVGRYSLFVMVFTLLTAFGGGYLFGRLFKMHWKLSSLISAGTGICGGSAIAAIAPTIEAEDKYIAYALSATFIFDILMVVAFPLMGRYFGMSDMGFGLWAGTAINDTSSVVAAGYSFSDAAGGYSVIVKLTRTLSIIPTVLIFSFINMKATATETPNIERKHVSIKKLFPYFIILFLVMVGIKSTGIIPDEVSVSCAEISKLFMAMALAAIGLKTNIKEVTSSGILPMVHGFIISLLVVVVSFVVQMMLHQI